MRWSSKSAQLNQFTRKADNDDFPIRGFALCPECKEPYTGSWSTGRNKKYPYYRCNTKECNLPKKSIKRDTLEACFESTLKEINPAKQIISLAKAITQDCFNKKVESKETNLAGLNNELKKVEKQIKAATTRLIETSSQTVQKAIEEKIEELEQEKKQLSKSVDQITNNKIDFGTALDAVMNFMQNPYKAWVMGDLKQKKLVQRLVFVNPIVIHPSQPIGTANLSFPFKMLRDISSGKVHMVEAAGVEPASVSPLPSDLHA